MTWGGFNPSMRKFIGVLSAIILACGCASHQSPGPKTAQPKSGPGKPVVTPDFRPVGKVVSVVPDGRFVVIGFAPGDVPKPETRLNIYHNGLKMAEVKVDAKWRMDNNVAADIVTGEVQVGDEARPD